MRILRNLTLLAALGGGVFYWLTLPDPLTEADVAGLKGDVAKGENVFLATGCASCHMAPESKDKTVLAGGYSMVSEFGTFYAPNISSDREHGIGDWSLLDLANALTRGVGREGEHLYPALPYAAYAKMELQDVADLYAYMQTLPADPTPSKPHDLSFPFNQRMLLGGWKFLFLSDDWGLPGNLTPSEHRGRYIAEAMAHCAECHTPRNALGGFEMAKWMGGAPNPSGQGEIPNITPKALGWSTGEIETYLTSGFTPDYDMVGGSMAHVVENFGALPPDYAADVAAYLARLPDVE